MIKEALATLVEGNDLKEQEMMAVMDEIMEGDATRGPDRRVVSPRSV